MPLSFCLPAHGDHILILKRPWLDMVLSGEKTMEIRHRSLRRGRTYYLGFGGHVHGSAVVSHVAAVESVAQWRTLLPQHRWDIAELPYQRTFAHSLTLVAKAAAPVPYRHPRGAIGLVRYRA